MGKIECYRRSKLKPAAQVIFEQQKIVHRLRIIDGETGLTQKIDRRFSDPRKKPNSFFEFLREILHQDGLSDQKIIAVQRESIRIWKRSRYPLRDCVHD